MNSRPGLDANESQRFFLLFLGLFLLTASVLYAVFGWPTLFAAPGFALLFAMFYGSLWFIRAKPGQRIAAVLFVLLYAAQIPIGLFYGWEDVTLAVGMFAIVCFVLIFGLAMSATQPFGFRVVLLSILGGMILLLAAIGFVLGLDYVPVALFILAFLNVAMGALADAAIQIRDRKKLEAEPLWKLLQENVPCFFFALGASVAMLGSTVQIYLFGAYGSETKSVEMWHELSYRSSTLYFDSRVADWHSRAGEIGTIGGLVAAIAMLFMIAGHFGEKWMKRRRRTGM